MKTQFISPIAIFVQALLVYDLNLLSESVAAKWVAYTSRSEYPRNKGLQVAHALPVSVVVDDCMDRSVVWSRILRRMFPHNACAE